MDGALIDSELSQWFSTYGLITAERILGKYSISLPQDDLLEALTSPLSFYHRLIQVPLKNVLNGIVLQQANDYHIYSQKLFIDYLLSGESGKDPESQGAFTRESLEDERKLLVTLGEQYHKKKLEHDSLIASSQVFLIQLTKEWNRAFESAINLFSTTLLQGFGIKKSTIRKAIQYAMSHSDLTFSRESNNTHAIIDKINEKFKVSMSDEIKEQLLDHLTDLLEVSSGFDLNISKFNERCSVIGEQARSYRVKFYDTILRVTALIKLLPEYKINREQDQINREPLYFDKNIGEL